jgi:RNAse (barnase) inhibitor barstar
LKAVLWTLAVALVATAGFLAYLGGFERVEIIERSQSPIQYIYRPLATVTSEQASEITSELDHLLDILGVDHRMPLDIVFPDGSAQIGFQLSDVEMNIALSNGTRVREIPRQDVMLTKFPLRASMSMSGRLADWKIYPQLKTHRIANGYAATEAMTRYESDVITYIQPIVKL